MSHEHDQAQEVQRKPHTFLVVSTDPYWTASLERLLPQFGSWETSTLSDVEMKAKELKQDPDVILFDAPAVGFEESLLALRHLKEIYP